MSCPFPLGSLVAWSKDAPATWHVVHTPGPMTVVSVRRDEGAPSEYSMKFGGIPRVPGWMVTVEYDADSTGYYDPPLSLLLGKKRIQGEIHQMWLQAHQT